MKLWHLISSCFSLLAELGVRLEKPIFVCVILAGPSYSPQSSPASRWEPRAERRVLHMLSSRLVFAYADADLFYSAEYVTNLLEPYHCLLRSSCLPCLCSSRALVMAFAQGLRAGQEARAGG